MCLWHLLIHNRTVRKMNQNNRRKLIRVEVVSAEKRRIPSKHYAYVIKVVWNDETETTIYRRYSKFFDFQIILLETFPYEGGLKEPSARIIPFLPGKILFRRSHVRDVAMKRLKPIDEYCKALIRLPPTISENDHVLDFFETKREDINPIRDDNQRKKKNEVLRFRTVRRTKSLDIGEISGPILLEQYLAIADYISTQPKELSIYVDQLLEVIEKNENGWWFVSNDEGERGWVPGVYLQKPDGSDEDLITKQAEIGQGEHYISIQPHNAETTDDISFGSGAVVEVLQKNLEGWWLINYNGKQGYAPASYLEKAHEWVQENNRRPLHPILTDSKQRHSLPANSLSTIASPGPHILHSGGLSVTNNSVDTTNGFAVKPTVPPVPVLKKWAVKPPPKKSSVKRLPPKRPDAPPPLPPYAKTEPTYEYMTIASFDASIPDGVSFNSDKKVQVLEKSPGGWWFIEIEGKEGWAPASYIEKKEKPKVPLPQRPGPPKLLKNNSTGNMNTNNSDDSRVKPPFVHPTPSPMSSISSSKSQSTISPAKRPLPPIPVSSSVVMFPESKTYEEVISTTIEEELPILRAPPLPPSQSQKIKAKVPGKPIPIADKPTNEMNGQIANVMADIRSRLKPVKQNDIKLAARENPTPPRPPTKPGSSEAIKPMLPKNTLALKRGFGANKPEIPPPITENKDISDKATTARLPKSQIQLPIHPVTNSPPKIPAKPKRMILNNVTPIPRNVQSSDDGAMVDFRSVLRSRQNSQSIDSNGVGRSKSFNSDKFIETKSKIQQDKPPIVPKKPNNMALRPPVPPKMKGLESTTAEGAEIVSREKNNNEKLSNVTKAPWLNGNKPVLRRFQSNNSNSNVPPSKRKQEIVVGHLRVELTAQPDRSTSFPKFGLRGSPDGQVDDKFEDGKQTKSKHLQVNTSFGNQLKSVLSKNLVCEDSKSSAFYVAISDYQGLEECEISFQCGDEVELLNEGENNWWYVKLEDKEGWAPSSFFRSHDEETVWCKPEKEIVQDAEDKVSDISYITPDHDEIYSEIEELYRVVARFEAEDTSMLTIVDGDEVRVCDRAEGGWWYVVLVTGDGEGWVPSNYLEKI